MAVVVIKKGNFLDKAKSIIKEWELAVPKCVGVLGAWRLSSGYEINLSNDLPQWLVECQVQRRLWNESIINDDETRCFLWY